MQHAHGTLSSTALWRVLTLAVLLAHPWGGAGAESDSSRLVFTGDVLGDFEPCDCSDQPFGGIAQRAFQVSERRGEIPGLLVLDAGNLLFRSLVSAGPEAEAYRKVGAMVLVDAYSMIGVDAVNVGPHDLVAGLEYLQKLQRRAAFPFLGTNLLDPQDGTPVFTPQLVVVRGDVRVAVIGLIRGGLEGRGYSSADPVATARAAVREARADGADHVVALSSMGLRDSRRLARKVRGLDAVLVAGDRTRTDPPPRVRGTPVIASGSRGKYLIEVELRSGTTTFRPVERLAPVDEEVEVLVNEARVRYQSPDFVDVVPDPAP